MVLIVGERQVEGDENSEWFSESTGELSACDFVACR